MGRQVNFRCEHNINNTGKKIQEAIFVADKLFYMLIMPREIDYEKMISI